MFLLLDQNISYRLLARINDIIPNARHIKDLNLWDGSDSEIFMEARKQGYDAILTVPINLHKPIQDRSKLSSCFTERPIGLLSTGIDGRTARI